MSSFCVTWHRSWQLVGVDHQSRTGLIYFSFISIFICPVCFVVSLAVLLCTEVGLLCMDMTFTCCVYEILTSMEWVNMSYGTLLWMKFLLCELCTDGVMLEVLVACYEYVCLQYFCIFFSTACKYTWIHKFCTILSILHKSWRQNYNNRFQSCLSLLYEPTTMFTHVHCVYKCPQNKVAALLL